MERLPRRVELKSQWAGRLLLGHIEKEQAWTETPASTALLECVYILDGVSFFVSQSHEYLHHVRKNGRISHQTPQPKQVKVCFIENGCLFVPKRYALRLSLRKKMWKYARQVDF